MDTVSNLMLALLLLPYLLLDGVVLDVGVDCSLVRALLRLLVLLAPRDLVLIGTRRHIGGVVRDGLVAGDLVLRIILLLRAEGVCSHYFGIIFENIEI